MVWAAYSSFHRASINMQAEEPTRALIEYEGGLQAFNPPTHPPAKPSSGPAQLRHRGLRLSPQTARLWAGEM